MPQVRKLSEVEVQTISHGRPSARKRTEQEYDSYLKDIGPGDYLEATLAPEEKRLTIRSRFKAAAERRGLAVEFLRTRGSLLRLRFSARPAEASGKKKGPAAMGGQGIQSKTRGASKGTPKT